MISPGLNFFSLLLIILATYTVYKYLFFDGLNSHIFNYIFFYNLFFILAFFLFAKSNDTDSIKYFTDGQVYQSSSSLLNYGSNLIISISNFLIKYLKVDYLSLNLIFGSLSTLGLLFLANLIQKNMIGHNLIFFLLLMILFFPSLNFFTSSTGKDSLMFCFVCILVWCLDDYNNSKMPLILISILMMMLTRLYIAIPIFLIISFFFPLIIEKKLSKIFYLSYYFLFFLLMIMGLYFLKDILVKAGIISELGGLSPNPANFNFEYLNSRMSVQFESTSGANSNYKDLHKNYLYYYFQYAFGPFLLEGQNGIKYFLTKFESQIYSLIIFIIFLFTGMSYKNKSLLIKNIMFFIIFFSITIPLSLSISNFGISIRQRVILYPFIIYILVSNLKYFLNEKKFNFNFFKSDYS